MGINEPNYNENRGVHSKSFIYCTGTGHCPGISHSYIKVTHHEWINSKEERFPLWLPRTPLCVQMQCCDQVIISSHLFNRKDSHTTKTDLHCCGIFNTGNSESCLCGWIVYTLKFNTWGQGLLKLSYNVECISGHKVTTVTKTNAWPSCYL